jgi:4-hydroxybenzoate polyprenyltransferase
MKISLILRSLSIISYCLIFIRGSMIGFPFIIFLFLALFASWWTIAQLTALLALIGLFSIAIYVESPKTKRILIIEAVIFLLLLLPIIERITDVPIALFNYAAFIIPCISFIVLYLLSLLFSFMEFNKQKL